MLHVGTLSSQTETRQLSCRNRLFLETLHLGRYMLQASQGMDGPNTRCLMCCRFMASITCCSRLYISMSDRPGGDIQG